MTDGEIAKSLREFQAELKKETRKLSHFMLEDIEKLIPDLLTALESLANMRVELDRRADADLEAYREAISGDGPHAFDWKDKPHRLVYDLIRIAQLARDAIKAGEKRLEFIVEQFGADDRERIDRINHLSVAHAQLNADIEHGFSALEAAGIPRARAQSIPNGIGVLETRFQRETDSLRRGQAAEIQYFRTAIQSFLDGDISSGKLIELIPGLDDHNYQKRFNEQEER